MALQVAEAVEAGGSPLEERVGDVHCPRDPSDEVERVPGRAQDVQPDVKGQGGVQKQVGAGSGGGVERGSVAA